MKFIILFLCTFIHCRTVYDKKQYTLKSYKDFFNFAENLIEDPSSTDLFKVEDVFKKYEQIKRPNCPEDYTGLCKSYLYTIADFKKGPQFYNKLPTILLIGGFHGNEVTGANSLYRLIELFHKYGKVNHQLQEILNRVKILILPTANVTGFAKQRREDFTDMSNPMDPNRDFPFNVQQGGKCLQTSTAQIIDQIFRNNLILSTITFHGGDNSITYPWGNYAHKNPITGDNLAFKQIANLLKDFAGANDDLKIEEYNVGTMKDVVYDVNGGFEDWAYGASWDTVNVPTTTDGKKSLPQYNSITNRAFVYLVEAGFDKIPSFNELGNELSIFHPYDEDAIWGHISRNTFMSLKFLEYQNPYVVVDEVRYQKGLIMKLIVKGCVHVSYLKISNLPFFILSKKVQPDTGHHIILVVIEKTVKYIPDIAIETQCDQEWFDKTAYQKPQSHFVKLRTQPGYEVMYKDQTIKSQYTIQTRLINIKTQEIKDAYLHTDDNNIYSFVYTTEYKIKMPTDQIEVSWDEGQIHFQTKSDSQYNLKVKKFGTASCCTNDTNGSVPLYEFNSKRSYAMTQKQFYELLGKSVEIFDPKINQTLYYSHFQILNEDQFSNMVLPANGLTCFSELIDNYFYITITHFSYDIIKIEMLTNISDNYKVQINDLNIVLEYNNDFNDTSDVMQFYKYVQLKNFNDFRLWGSYIKVINSYDTIVYKDILKPLNPYFNEIEQIKQSKGFLKIRKPIENQKLKSKYFMRKKESKAPLIILGIAVIIIIIALIYIFASKKDKENLNDQTNVQEKAKEDANKILVNQI